MKQKIYQLVEHSETTFTYYGIHEALIDREEIYWIGSKAIRKYDNYQQAVEAWGKMEPRSGYLDILDDAEASRYYDRLEYTDVQELDFND